MDPCRVGTNLNNARAMIRTNLGVPREFANKMSANAICKAYKNCKHTTILPPMDFHMVNGQGYCIDPRSPLSVKDYLVLFGKEGDLNRIAKKVGLVPIGLSRKILKASIIDMLKSLDISEPIELPSKRAPRTSSSNNLGNLNQFPSEAPSGSRNELPSGNGLPSASLSNNKGSLSNGGVAKINYNYNNKNNYNTPGLPPKHVHPTKFTIKVKRKSNNYNYSNSNSNSNNVHNKLNRELEKMAAQARLIKREIGSENNYSL